MPCHEFKVQCILGFFGIALLSMQHFLDHVMAGSATLLAFVAIGIPRKILLFAMKIFDKQL